MALIRPRSSVRIRLALLQYQSDVAQLEEQRSPKSPVAGSTPAVGAAGPGVEIAVCTAAPPDHVGRRRPPTMACEGSTALSSGAAQPDAGSSSCAGSTMASAPPCHGGLCEFESRLARSKETLGRSPGRPPSRGPSLHRRSWHLAGRSGPQAGSVAEAHLPHAHRESPADLDLGEADSLGMRHGVDRHEAMPSVRLMTRLQGNRR